MKGQLAVQKLLVQKLAVVQSQNPRYSLRAYASKVGVHVGALSSILNGRRNVSRKLAERIAARLLLDPQERSELLALFPVKRAYTKEATPKTDSTDPRYLEFNASQFKIAAEWEHIAVMSLVNCDDFQNKTEWIAKRLGITETRARQVIDRLLQLGLFNLDADGNLTRSKQGFRTSDDVADISIKRAHEQSFELAKESLYRDPVKVRDMTSVTMSIDPSKISMTKELIRKFQDALSEMLETGKRTEVFRLSMQLYPLTQIEPGELK